MAVVGQHGRSNTRLRRTSWCVRACRDLVVEAPPAHSFTQVVQLRKSRWLAELGKCRLEAASDGAPIEPLIQRVGRENTLEVENACRNRAE
ncbi:MAG: hypothetical protein ABI862_19850 [Ilumatobacteraceae bacterium]